MDGHAEEEQQLMTAVEEISQEMSMGTGEDAASRLKISAVTLRLYLSHFLSTWNSRVFEFGVVLYLSDLFPGTLLPMSIYAVARAAAGIVLSPAVGRYIDHGDRLEVVRLSIVSQRVAVMISCGTLWLLSRSMEIPTFARLSALALLAVLACVEKLGSIMNLVAVERDWVVAIAESDTDLLNTLNAQMRRIDLICKLMGPLLISCVDAYSTRIAILLNLGMSVLSLPIEYFAIASVYHQTPNLRKTDPDQEIESTPANDGLCTKNLREVLFSFIRQNRAYIKHPVFLASFSLSILYFTVLSFGGQMVTYLLSTGYSSITVGAARTVAAVFEMAATWLAPVVVSKIGPVRSGAWFSSWQTICLACGIAMFWSASTPLLSATSLVVSTGLSRIGLWGYDLSVQIIVQDEVEPDERGAFSTAEASWQNFFELCSFASTVIFSKPEQFRWPALMSFGATCFASALYACFVRARRGHLVHWSDCVEKVRGRRSASAVANRTYELFPHRFRRGMR